MLDQADVSDLTVEVTGDTATALFYPACRIESESGMRFDLDREALNGSDLQLSFTRVDKQWRVSGADPLTED